MRPRLGPLSYLLAAGIIAAAIALRFADPFPVAQLRLIGFDSYQRVSPEQPDPDLPVRVVDIDEDTLARVHPWPWPRTRHAELVDTLREAGAAAIVFDIFFTSPDPLSVEAVASRLPPEMGAELTALSDGQPPNDAVFAEAIGRLPTVLAATLVNSPTEPPGFRWGFAVAGDDPKPFMRPFAGIASNLPILNEAAAGLGAINWFPERDQIVRRAPLILRFNDTFVPSLPIEALRVVQGASTYTLRGSNASGQTAFGQVKGLNAIRVGAAEIPSDPDGSMWLKFRQSDPASYLPAWSVLAGETPAEEIAGRIILIGTSAAGLNDLRATPLQDSVPGVDVHAQTIEHILRGSFLTRPDYGLGAELGLTAVLGLALMLLFPRVPAVLAATLGIATAAALPVAGWLLYDRAGLLFDSTFPMLALLALTGAITLYIYRTTERQRGEIRRAFAYYVSPVVVDEIIARPDKLKLGGEIRELTVLFSDVRNFTSISEQLSATELTQFINGLLTPMSEIILKERGTIDKYMGDAVMAFWNAPLDEPMHPERAVHAALAMIAEMRKLNVKWREDFAAAGRSIGEVRIGVGINTGDCCVGNLGSVQRFDYSAIGDEVNVASRLEGLCKLYGVPIVIHEATMKRVPELAALELDVVRVKGRAEAARIFTLLDALEIEGSRERLVAEHAGFWSAYRGRNWDVAAAALTTCHELCKGLGEFRALFEERIEGWRLDPPPADWDGSYTATSK
ncbi:MAG: adenylate/guanylate cyclase domain-containing protein [Bauldia sp.]|nr:adenylate/guanylate cyclase domain-containing protein [Bauldia sp.]